MPAVMILADEDFASRERGMLARLEVGLVSEGLRVLHAVPDTLPELLDGRVFSQAIGYAPRGPLPPISRRAKDLARGALHAAPGDGIAVVHVFGGEAWRMGFEVAGLLGAAVVLEVFAARQADALSAAHFDALSDRVVVCVPGVGLERRCLRKLDSRHLRLVRWGVHPEGTQRAQRLAAGDRPAVLLAGTGADAQAWGHALESLSRVRLDGDQPPLIFADADAAHRAHLRQVVERLALAEHVSFVPLVEARREPVLAVDALVMPDALHQHRSLVLDAHAQGLLVAAASDPVIDELGPEYGVTQLDTADPDRWTEELRRVFEDHRLADERRSKGFEAVLAMHAANVNAASVRSVYEFMLASKSG